MSKDDDPTFLVQILEDFRDTIGRSSSLSRHRASNVTSRMCLDDSLEVSDNFKRKQSFSDDISDTSCKVLKLDSTPTSRRESYDKNNRLSPSASPWESHHVRSQLVDANIKISDLENQISHLHALRQEMELVFQKDRESLQKQVDCERSKSRELDNHLNVIRKREAEIKEEFKVFKSQANKDKLSFEEHIYEIEKENSKLKDTLQENEQNFRTERMNFVRHIHHLKAEVNEKEEQVNDIKIRNSELEQRLKEELQIQIELDKTKQELQNAQIKIKELEREREDYLEASALVKSQEQKVLQYSELEKEVSSLREVNSNLKNAIPNKLLLEEMVQDLKSRQSVTEGQEQELAWAQSHVNHLQTVLEQWYAVARDHCDGCMSSSHPPDPRVIRKKINELQQRVHILTADVGDIKSQLTEAIQKKDLLVIDNQASKKEVEKYQSIGEQLNNKLRLMQRKLQLVTMERDSYRSQLDTYEKDLTISSSSLAGQNNQQQMQQLQRIETMDKLLDGYRRMLEKMEMDSDKPKGFTGNAELFEKLNHLQCEYNKLMQEKELLQQRKDELEIQLEYRALKGDFNPTTSKILHFRMNPAAEAAAQYEDEVIQLRSKCARLEERLKLIEEGNIQDITQKVEENVASSNAQEVKDLQDAIAAQELKMQRLKEVFHQSAKEFREVCYELFGYRIDRNENIFKLTSMYADSPNDHLMFKRENDGTIDMVETPFSATLGELIEINLLQHHSYPLFLGGITLDLFSRQTMVQSVD